MRTNSDFLIHDGGMEFLGYIGAIRKNETEYEQHQNLGSINLAWGSLDTSREYNKKAIWNMNKI